MKDRYLSHFTHELRTLISAVFACTDLLADAVRDQPEASHLVGTIRKNSGCLLNLVNNALDLSKIEAGEMPVERVLCDTGQVILELVALMQPKAIEKGLRLNATCLGSIPQTIRTDPWRLRQVLLNLLDNAIKFTERGGVDLTVELERPGGATGGGVVVFRVADTGIGMTPRSLERVFDPFVQADSVTTRHYGGTGLGLTISKRVAQLLGGDLVVASRLGEGSTVTLTVPTGSLEGVAMIDRVPQLVLGVLPKGQRVAADRGRPGRLSGVCMLLAVERCESQLLLSAVFKNAGASVTLTTCNEDAVVEQVVSANGAGRPFDVILLDGDGVNKDGVVTPQLLRRCGCQSPIMAISTHSGKNNNQRAAWQEAGYADYLMIPDDIGIAVVTVARVMTYEGAVS